MVSNEDMDIFYVTIWTHIDHTVLSQNATFGTDDMKFTGVIIATELIRRENYLHLNSSTPEVLDRFL